MKKSSGFIFRELQGHELKAILTEYLIDEFKAEVEKALDSTNRFFIGDSYPVVTVTGDLVVKVLPDEKEPQPFTISVKMDIGRTLLTAPDRMRELYGLTVLQPQQTAKGMMVNTAVEENPHGRPEEKIGRASCRERV